MTLGRLLMNGVNQALIEYQVMEMLTECRLGIDRDID